MVPNRAKHHIFCPICTIIKLIWNNTISNLLRTIKWKSITINCTTCNSIVLKQFDLSSNTLKNVKIKLEMCTIINNTSYIFLSWLHQNWKSNIVITKIVTAKRKALLSIKRTYKINFSKLQVRKQVTLRIRLGSRHNEGPNRVDI